MIQRGDSAPLLHSYDTPPGLLFALLQPPKKEGNGTVRACPEEGHKNGQRAGAPLLSSLVELSLFSHEKRRLWQQLLAVCQCLKGATG